MRGRSNDAGGLLLYHAAQSTSHLHARRTTPHPSHHHSSFEFHFPSHCLFQLQGRYWFIKVLGRVLLAPFFFVTFEDFWLGDQLNSLNTTILDLFLLFCYFGTGLVCTIISP